jgi:uncharacterized protein with HEPN domain
MSRDNQRDPAAIQDMIRVAERIVEFIDGFDQESFLGDQKTQSAVVHELTIIGETAKRLSLVARKVHPEIEWKDIVGARDV